MPNNDDNSLQKWQNTNIDVLKHQKAICLLVAGQSVDETCNQLGIDKRTLQRWFKYPEFNQNLARAIRHVYTSTFAKAVSYTDRALDTLMTIIDDVDTPSKYRIEAIKILFDYTRMNMSDLGGSQSEISKRLNYQSYLFGLHDNTKSAANSLDKFVGDKVAFDNARAVWAELYPNEPYPESPKQVWRDELPPDYFQ